MITYNMPNSLSAKLRELNYQGKFSDEEYEELINKLNRHDEALLKKSMETILELGDLMRTIQTEITLLDTTGLTGEQVKERVLNIITENAAHELEKEKPKSAADVFHQYMDEGKLCIQQGAAEPRTYK